MGGWLRSRPSSLFIKAFQDGLVARLPQEAQQIVWAEPHAGGVGHGVEVDPVVASLDQVLVQDQAHALVPIEEQSEGGGTSLPHLRAGGDPGASARRGLGTGGHLSHLQPLQHGRLVGEAQVSAADAQLLGQVVEVDLRSARG